MSESGATSTGKLLGIWRLDWVLAADATGWGLLPPSGPMPIGAQVFYRDGRMLAVLRDGSPLIPDGEVRGYRSYCDNFRVDNRRLIITVGAATLAELIGGEKVRQLEHRGGQLVLTAPRRTDGARRFAMSLTTWRPGYSKNAD